MALRCLLRFLVALSSVRDLLLCAKHLLFEPWWRGQPRGHPTTNSDRLACFDGRTARSSGRPAGPDNPPAAIPGAAAPPGTTPCLPGPTGRALLLWASHQKAGTGGNVEKKTRLGNGAGIHSNKCFSIERWSSVGGKFNPRARVSAPTRFGEELGGTSNPLRSASDTLLGASGLTRVNPRSRLVPPAGFAALPGVLPNRTGGLCAGDSRAAPAKMQMQGRAAVSASRALNSQR